jgi:butyrate kinase
MSEFTILVINPKYNYTQSALYNDHKLIVLTKINHSQELIEKYHHYNDQLSFRKEAIIKEIESNDLRFDKLKVVIARGGLVKPVASGIYEMNDKLRKDLMYSPFGDDVVNLGGLLADEIANMFPDARAIIADPVVVDELDEVARVSGHPLFTRKSVFHALNQKDIAKMHAKTTSARYEDLNLIVAHLGNGTSVGAHCKGRVIDVNQGYDGDGPFSATRSGSLPIGDVIRKCYSGQYSEEEILEMVRSHGGLLAHLGTSHISEIEKRIEGGDEHATFIIEAMGYQVAKCIGSMFAVLKAEVDAILITGGLAHSNTLIEQIIAHIGQLAPVFIYAGDDEVKAMATNALQVLKGTLEVKEYV